MQDRLMCCRPLPSNFPPACSVVMMTSRADLLLYFGCGSTGMPRPLSATDKRTISGQMNFYPGRVSGHGFVHRVIDDFSKQMVKCLFVPCRRYTYQAVVCEPVPDLRGLRCLQLYSFLMRQRSCVHAPIFESWHPVVLRIDRAGEICARGLPCRHQLRAIESAAEFACCRHAEH